MIYYRKALKYLKQWKNSKYRKPLIIRGARQVGKTSVVRRFASENYEQFIEINLEKKEDIDSFGGEMSLEDFEKTVQVRFSKKITEGDTLLFLDEIQNAPFLIKLLRFFYEEKPGWHIIASGSLLEVRLFQKGFEFPVGRVSYYYMYPVDFFEYLKIKNENGLLEFLENIKIQERIPDGIHQEAMKKFYSYMMTGGMPEALSCYLETHDFKKMNEIFNALMESFKEDIYKYQNPSSAKYLTFILDHIQHHAGSAIQFQKYGGEGYRSREMGEAFEILQKSMLLYALKGTSGTELPLMEKSKKPKKIIFLDTGLLNFLMGIQDELIQMKELNELYRGRIAEQITGQMLISESTERLVPLMYWSRDKQEADAEVDFCFPMAQKIAAVEVKAGTSTRLKSLISFAHLVKNPKLYRFYSGPFTYETLLVEGRKENLISLPFYLVPRYKDF